MKWAYYQDNDKQKCEWVRELIKAGVVTDGEVDCRDIQSVTADDVREFRRVHFFCGIAVWDYALNLAGWPDDRGCWTGSCPCPSFSSAGKGRGFDDARHLWPHWFRLISQSRPATLFGEQVAAAIGHGWLDLVSTDLEAEGYAVAAAVLGAHSAGAPHIRQRLFFVADTTESRRDGAREHHGRPSSLSARPEQCSQAGFVADTEHDGLTSADGLREATEPSRQTGQNSQRKLAGSGDTGELVESQSIGHKRSGEARRWRDGLEDASATGELGNASSEGLSQRERDGRIQPSAMESREGQAAVSGSHINFWSDAEWLPCRDGKFRPVRPGTFPLVNGAAARVLRLRGYGDAINCQTAKEFIAAYQEAAIDPGGAGVEIERDT